MDNTNVPLQTMANSGSLATRGRNLIAQMQAMTYQPAVRRAIPAIALLAASFFALFMYSVLGEQSKATLYTGMPESEKSRAVDVLVSGGIDATINETTGAITVLQSDYHKARMILAAEGLPQGIPDGYSVISEMPMGTSRSVEAARLRQMQELELARSISELDTVSGARVHLALPERTAFVRDTKPPSASVILTIKPGRSLDEGQVEAIVSLVSTSVPDLPRAAVSVVDQTGRLLSAMSSDPIQNLTDQQVKHQLKVENLLRSRIEALVLPIVGVGNAAVEVTLDMDFTRSEVTSEQYAPDLTALRSEQQMSEESARDAARGIPGAVSNTPSPDANLNTQAPEQNGDNPAAAMANRSSSSTKNYEVSRIVETTRPSATKILRINAAVLLREPSGEGDTPAPYNEDFLKDIERLAASAIGFDKERGDTITVSSRPFAQPVIAPELPWYETAWMSQAGRQAIQLIALAIIILGIVRPILNRVLLTPPEAEFGAEEMAYAAQVEVAEGDSLDDLQSKLDDVMRAGADAQEVSYEDKIALIRHLAGNDTTRIATVFQNMIDAEEDAVQ